MRPRSLLTLNRATVVVSATGSTARVDADQIDVRGTVTLNDAVLRWNVNADLLRPVGTVVRLVNNDGTDPVNGIFQDPNGAALAEGSVLSVDHWRPAWFQISYRGGDGNDVTATHLPSATPVAAVAPGGYWMMDASGTVYGFGTAKEFDPPVRPGLFSTAVDL
jgi:hypothetical protein